MMRGVLRRGGSRLTLRVGGDEISVGADDLGVDDGWLRTVSGQPSAMQAT